jgi:hypothetical protein
LTRSRRSLSPILDTTREYRSVILTFVSGALFLVCWFWFLQSDVDAGQLLNDAGVALLSDSLDQQMRTLAPYGKDCGRVRIGEDARAATDCAMSSFNRKRSFRVRYDMEGIDSDVAVGLVGDSAGAVTALIFDGDPSGGGGTSLRRQRVGVSPCPTPVRLSTSAKGRLNCFQPDPKAERNVMSPTFESY